MVTVTTAPRPVAPRPDQGRFALIGGAVAAQARLTAIEARRSPGVAFFLPLAALVAWATWASRANNVVLWVDLSVALGFASILCGPASAGIAAWVAAREPRRNTTELLASTPSSSPVRGLRAWATMTGWAVLAYGAGGAAVLAWLGREATWGEAELPVIGVGLVTVVAASALGHLAGTLLPSRLTPPLVAVGMVVLALGVDAIDLGAAATLSPGRYFNGWGGVSPLFGVWPPAGGPMSLWLLGLTGTALAVAGLVRMRSATAVAALATAVAMAGTGATLMVGTFNAPRPTDADVRPFVPVCAPASVVPVCVHPAYGAALGETTRAVDAVLRPIAGLPGAPVVAELELRLPPEHRTVSPSSSPVGSAWDEELRLPPEYRTASAGGSPTGVLEIPAFIREAPLDLVVDVLAQRAVHGDQGERQAASACGYRNEAQVAIAAWLARQSGLGGETPSLGSTCRTEAELLAVIDRFAALPPDQQRAWLGSHLVALRAGDLTLEDLP